MSVVNNISFLSAYVSVSLRIWYDYCPYNYLYFMFAFSPETQILDLCQEKQQIAAKMHAIIDRFAERGLRSLAVAFQVMVFLVYLLLQLTSH